MAPVKQFDNNLKLGKTPARPEAVKLKFAQYSNLAVLPTPPPDFGHENLVPNYPMLLNNKLGDCVIAGKLHQIQLYNRERGRTVSPSDNDALRNYELIGGYNPSDPSSDQGCDMELAAKTWRTRGILAQGSQHKIVAYVALEPGNMNQLRTACYLFSAVGIGIQFPNFAMDQFDAGKPWDISNTNTSVEGGHYVPAVASRGGNILVITWGRVIQMTPAFYAKYCDEAIVHFSSEMMLRGKSLEGFNNVALSSDLTAVTHQQ